MNFENNYTKIEFDAFPSVKITVKDHSPTEKEFEDFMAAMKATYANQKNRIVLFDLVNAQNVPFSNQISFAKWSKEMEPNFENYLKGVTFHVGNSIIKSILKSIFFLQKPNYEFKVFTKDSEVAAHQEILKKRVL